MGFKFFPEPACHAFDGGALEAFDVVEVAVVEAINERLHGVANAFVIIDPTDGLIDFAFDCDANVEGMAVHLAAFVTLGQGGKGVSRFEMEILVKPRNHWA